MNDDHNKPDPNFDYHEQRGHDNSLGHAFKALIGIVVIATITILVLVENSDAPMITKLGICGMAVGAFYVFFGEDL
jgi:hypothetical protein